MDNTFKESEWKLFRKYRDQMLEDLCGRINTKSERLLHDDTITNYERYLALFDHVRDADEVVAECFNNWRRSSFRIFTANLARQELIPPDLWNQLSEETRARIERIKDL